ncbi:MAG TPA: histidinol dehydrogenase, partial [Gammaproteobacteria bacterium]|nr:histidinol dehydrogenase [Gammaproteobacteria bacterium]
AAQIAGVTKIYSIGGAQAIGALAFGTETIPKVSKIVGPGNAYVATAKRMVFGAVGIDMIAGPSEIMVIADQDCDANTVALDLFSQAEHDEVARVFCISTDRDFLQRLKEAINRLWADFPRAKIIQQALQNCSALIETPDMDCAIEIANLIAPEHLELQAAEAIQREAEFIHAGAIFIGEASSEALGDYCAGPNHVLPTSATARFASPLGVYDFVTRTSIVRCSEAGASQLANVAARIARAEGLEAHARSAEARLKKSV